MASHFSAINQEVHNYMTQDIPDCEKSNNSAQCIKTRNRIFQISSTSSSQNSGGVILFNVPPANYSISKGTMILRCRIQVTGTSLDNADATKSVGFQGPGVINAGNFAPTLGNGYSWIQRITAYGSNSAVLEQINYCNDQMNLMLIHNSNSNYLTGDASQLIGTNMTWGYNGGTNVNAQIDLCLPIPLNVFNSPTQNFPSYLLSSPMTIQIDLASVARAIYRGSACTVTDYTVSNTFLCFQSVELPQAFIEGERQAIKSHPFVMDIPNTMNVQVPMSVLSSYTLGLNASSVRAVFILPSNEAGYSSARQLQYIRSTSDSSSVPTFNGSGVNALVFADGNVVSSMNSDTPAATFYNLKLALHHNIQGSVIYSSPYMSGLNSYVGATTSWSNYLTQYYMLGFDLTSYDNQGTLMGGQPATNINLQLTGYTNPTYLATIIVCYDVLICFEGDGSMQVKR